MTAEPDSRQVLCMPCSPTVHFSGVILLQVTADVLQLETWISIRESKSISFKTLHKCLIKWNSLFFLHLKQLTYNVALWQPRLSLFQTGKKWTESMNCYGIIPFNCDMSISILGYLYRGQTSQSKMRKWGDLLYKALKAIYPNGNC